MLTNPMFLLLPFPAGFLFRRAPGESAQKQAQGKVEAAELENHLNCGDPVTKIPYTARTRPSWAYGAV